MGRIWRWYWRTLSESWGKMDRPKRRRFVVVMIVSFTIAAAAVVAAAFLPHARGPLIVGFVVLWLVAHWSLTLVSARRGRRKRG